MPYDSKAQKITATGSLYYFHLRHLGADLDYVRSLCAQLSEWDRQTRNMEQAAPKRERTKADRRKESFDRFAKRYSREIDRDLEAVALRAMKMTVHSLAKRYIREPDADSWVQELDLPSILKGARFGYEFEKITASLSSDAPLFGIRRRGNQPDHVGTQFLVLITEHLREATGKPHYREAARLLVAVRKENSSPRAPKITARSAQVRCNEWKQTIPGWDADVRAMRALLTQVSDQQSLPHTLDAEAEHTLMNA
jgi:hypothetical protein